MNFPDSLSTTASTTRRMETPLRTLIIDNYDSYTFNLLQLFDQDQLDNVVVIHNDQVAWSQFEQDVLPYFDQIILSPGPGRPERAQDFGICTQILKTSHIPIFGVCLGHQGIGWTHGAKITYGPEPVHGQIAHIKHENAGLFEGIPQEFEAVRYHSLVIQEQDLPPDLIPTAWCHSFPLIPANNLGTENVVTISNTDRALGSKSIMGVRHKTLPHHGVQFHPESICTQYGKQMMGNFFKIACEFYVDQDRTHHMQMIPDHIRRLSVVPTKPPLDKNPSILRHQAQKNPANPYNLFIHALDPTIFPEPEAVFSSLFLTGPRSKAASWWLDSARQPHPMSRFSFMGGMETRCCHDQGTTRGQRVPGASQAVIQYSTLHKEIRVHRYMAQSEGTDVKQIHLGRTVPGKDVTPTTFWDWISHVMGDFSKENIETTVIGPSGEQRDFEEVPFDFFAGMIGYLGYEMKRESLEGYQTPIEQQCHCPAHSGTKRACTCDCLRRPDASFVLATQAVVFDHVERRIYVLGIVNNQPERSQEDIGEPVGFNSRESCENWIQNVTRSIVYLANNRSPYTTIRRKSAVALPMQNGSKGEPYLVKQRHRRQSSVGLLSPFKVDVTEEDYLKAIQDSLDYIHEGESYELCLTTQFRAKIPLYTQQSPARQDGKDQDQSQSTGDPAFDLYRILRKLNPAPFSAFLSVPTALDGEDKIDEVIGKLVILSSSPERFLKIGKKPSDEAMRAGDESSTSRTVEMKPIKGTVAVAKGCFCKEDEGCGVDGQDDGDSSEHTDEDEVEDEDEEMKNNHEKSHMTMRTAGIADDERRRSIIDRCAEARRRENQSRIDSLSKNIKERAENLMIVDLIRNDLAHVCTSKSVRVPYLMHVESYETVHQLVTTVRGELFDHVDNTQAVRACFPPGSMTGAPKLRSVQLLDSLEHHVTRGVYSGCLGYIGIPAVAAATFSKTKEGVQPKVRSAVDLAVVIRTAVLTIDPSEDKEASTTVVGGTSLVHTTYLSVGAGGALTILSDANEEWREVLLKSRSVVPSVLTYLHQHTANA
ncbi:Protein phosphatase PP2A regulatory subunit B [Haplosporangium sp. Z 11]|nr:Protein phosphatase PP2A regulatory subunit B [Haplosporangium sp. Z 11]